MSTKKNRYSRVYVYDLLADLACEAELSGDSSSSGFWLTLQSQLCRSISTPIQIIRSANRYLKEVRF